MSQQSNESEKRIVFDIEFLSTALKLLPTSKLSGIQVYSAIMYVIIGGAIYCTNGFTELFIKYTYYGAGLFLLIYFLVINWMREMKSIKKS